MIFAFALIALSAVAGLPSAVFTVPARADTPGGSSVGTAHAYDVFSSVKAKKTILFGNFPTASVDQAQQLTDQVVHVSWTGETPSVRSNQASDATPGQSVPFDPVNTTYPVGIYECKTARPTNLTNDCFTALAGSTIGQGGLGNAVGTVTGDDGTGSADFHVETGKTNSFLGCSVSHQCSLVVVPAWGSGPASNCDNHKSDLSGPQNGYMPSNYPPTYNDINGGQDPCGWLSRIVIPISFAPTATDCPVRQPSFSAVGSPMLERAMLQWQSGWCRDSSPLTLSYNSSSGEDAARLGFSAGSGAFTARTDVALTTRPADVNDKTATYAPISNTDIAIAFYLDDGVTRKPITDINLNAELVAKLLTQSYSPSNFACYDDPTGTKQTQTCDPAVRGNPSAIQFDPQFRLLNPQFTWIKYSNGTYYSPDFGYTEGTSFGAFFPSVVAGQTDLIYELTSWIESDQQARAFLGGKSDPANGPLPGMHVNTYYKNVAWPANELFSQDPGYTDVSPSAPAGNGTMQNAWQPISLLDNVGTTLVTDRASAVSQHDCPSVPPCPFTKIPEPLGSRQLFGIMDQGQAAAYKFPTAHLLNQFDHPIQPSESAVLSGITASVANPDGITHHPDFSVNAPKSAADAYPLSVTDYAMVHTCGQSSSVAAAVRNYLTKVGQSQSPGTEPGDLAAGFLPLTKTQHTQLLAARSKVSSEPCSVKSNETPPRVPQSHDRGAQPAQNSAPNPSSGPSANNGSGPGASGPAGNNKAVSQTAPNKSNSRTAAFVTKPDRVGFARYIVPILIGIVAVLLLASPTAFVLMNTSAGSAAVGWLRRMRP